MPIASNEISLYPARDPLRGFYDEACLTEPTASASVAAALRKAIFEGVMGEGKRLRQDDLAEVLGVSRMPIREAIRVLEAEGLVVFEHHRGAVVSALSIADVFEISELRITLECLALSLSVPNLSEADLERAQHLIDTAHEGLSPADHTRLNLEFHGLLYARSGRRRLLHQIDGLHLAYERYLRIEHSLLSYDKQTDTDHRRILEACRRRNADIAAAELKEHISVASAELILLLQQSYFGKKPA